MKNKKSKIQFADVRPILTAIRSVNGVKVTELRSHKRDRKYFYSRMIFTNYCQKEFTLHAIALYLGIKSHNAILHQIRTFKIDIQNTKEFKLLHDSVMSNLPNDLNK